MVGLFNLLAKFVYWAPLGINTTLPGRTYPTGKIDHFSQLKIFLLEIKTQQAISGTRAATYKLMEPYLRTADIEPTFFLQL